MWWMEMFINELMVQGQCHGAAFCEEHGNVNGVYIFFVKYLKEV